MYFGGVVIFHILLYVAWRIELKHFNCSLGELKISTPSSLLLEGEGSNIFLLTLLPPSYLQRAISYGPPKVQISGVTFHCTIRSIGLMNEWLGTFLISYSSFSKACSNRSFSWSQKQVLRWRKNWKNWKSYEAANDQTQFDWSSEKKINFCYGCVFWSASGCFACHLLVKRIFLGLFPCFSVT